MSRRHRETDAGEGLAGGTGIAEIDAIQSQRGGASIAGDPGAIGDRHMFGLDRVDAPGRAQSVGQLTADLRDLGNR